MCFIEELSATHSGQLLPPIVPPLPQVGTRSKLTFSEQRFKSLRILTATGAHVAKGLFYQILSSSYSLFKSEHAERYAALRNYHYKSGLVRAYFYLIFKDAVIDFSVNSYLRIKENSSLTDYEKLLQLYGKKAVTQQFHMKSQYYSVQKKHLRVGGMNSKFGEHSNGCCAGISFEFISSYLREIKMGKDDLEAVKVSALPFVNGATPKAELAQICLAALQRKKRNTFLKQLGAIERENSRLCEEIRLAEVNLDLRSKARKRTNECIDLIVKMRILKEKTIIIEEEAAPWGEDYINAWAKSGDFKMKSVGKYLFGDTEGRKERFLHFVNELSDGVYMVRLQPKEGVGHALVFVKKAAGMDFIFDPDGGALTLNRKDSIDGLFSTANSLSSLFFQNEKDIDYSMQFIFCS
jgi:hypothetical protein